MKIKLLLAFVMTFVFEGMYSHEISRKVFEDESSKLGDDVKIMSSSEYVDGNNIKVSFDIMCEAEGYYNASFWLLPAMSSDGSFVKYQLEVNGHKQSVEIVPTAEDWQNYVLSEKEKIFLTKGMNTVSVIGELPDIPSVEHMKLSKNRRKVIEDSDRYTEYKLSVEKESLVTSIGASSISNNGTNGGKYAESSLTSDQGKDYLYDFDYVKDFEYEYSFYKDLYLLANNTVSISASGIGNFYHSLYLFNFDNPQTFSWSALSKSNSASESLLESVSVLDVKVPISGKYRILILPARWGEKGLCNVKINNAIVHSKVPVVANAVMCRQNTEEDYNVFTAHSTGDPIIWIASGMQSPGRIADYNDDYKGDGYFDWGRNARVKGKYNGLDYSVYVTGTQSYNPQGVCDLYMRCKTFVPSQKQKDNYTQMKEDDLFLSSPSSGIYNCISWTGGIVDYWEWPPVYGSDYCCDDPLESFDNFYREVSSLTRIDANEDNAVVALWGIEDLKTGETTYTHACIRNLGNWKPVMHGYEWESKLGANERIFHPRDAVTSTNYGHIVEYYRPNNEFTFKSFDERIADGELRIEYEEFTDAEKAFIDNASSKIDNVTLEMFGALYEKWQMVTLNTLLSNPVKISECEEFDRVYEYCLTHKDCLYLIYKKLSQADLPAMILIERIIMGNPSDNSLMAEIKEANRLGKKTRKDTAIVYRPLQSNYVAYVKRLLETGNKDMRRNVSSASVGISYSNSFDFTVEYSQNGINIKYELIDPAGNISLSVIDLNGNLVWRAGDNKSISEGKHEYSVRNLKEGVYLVRLIVNGKINVQKINVS